jgi:hypothetical protein
LASLDPRKSESITNQVNYLLTIVTSLLGGALYAAIQSGIVNMELFWVLGGFWVIAAGYREIQKVIDHYTSRGPSDSDSGEGRESPRPVY